MSKNKKLESFDYVYGDITDPGLKTLDLSNNIALTDVNIEAPLTHLNLKNGFNKNINYIQAGASECFQVDDAEWSEENWELNQVYSEDCYEESFY